MHKLQLKNLLKSFRFKILILVLLALTVSALVYLKIKNPGNRTYDYAFDNQKTGNLLDVNYDILKDKIDRDIDSVLYNFGIKKDWISTSYPGDKPVISKKEKSKKEPVKARWFSKNVSIPKDVISSEINLDLTNYFSSFGLFTSVNEDIKTADIIIDVIQSEDTVNIQFPFLKINIQHSDKIQRETGTYVIILNNIWDYKPDELDNIISNYPEFSLMFPRNLDQIELQNKLIQMKKDVIINLTIGENDKPDNDFYPGIDDKILKQRVKSFITDFPYIKTLLITHSEPVLTQNKLLPQLAVEFSKFEVKIVPDSLFVKIDSKDNDSKNNVQNILSRLKTGISNRGTFFGIISVSYDDFLKLYEGFSSLKKAGYKFYNYAQYRTRETDKNEKATQKNNPNTKTGTKDANPTPKKQKKTQK